MGLPSENFLGQEGIKGILALKGNNPNDNTLE